MSESPINNYLEQLIRDVRRSPAVRAAQQAAEAVAAFDRAAGAKALELQRRFAASPAAAWLDETSRQTGATVQRANRWLEEFNVRYPDWPAHVARVLENVQAMARRGLAPNWTDLEGEDLEATILLMNDAQVNLAWAPNDDVLRELISVGAANADGVLAARAADIVDQLHVVINDVCDPSLVMAANVAREALDAHSNGTPAAAQALATVLLGNIVHDLHGISKFAYAHNTYKKLDPEKAAYDELRLTAINRCLSAACAGKNAPGTNFHRNRSAHRVDPSQYTPANAIRALLLIVGLLREEQFWIDEEAVADQAA